VKGKQVAVLGNPVLDCVLGIERLPLAAGERQEIRQLTVTAGGTANTLIAGARLGLAMQALGVVGDDVAGRQLRDCLRSEGIDTHLVIAATGRSTTTVFVLVAPDGGTSFLGHHSTLASPALPEDWVAAIHNAAALYCDGWTYGSLGPEPVLAAVQHAAAAGVPVFFDPGPRAGQLSGDWLDELLRYVTVLTLTEEEARALTPGTAGVEEMACGLRGRGPRWIIVKRGVLGCLVHDGVETVAHSGFKVPVRDTTGAGDAVAAAVILAWLRSYDMPTTAALVNAAGAVAVQQLGGGLSMPTGAEIGALLQGEGITLAT
jgi:sugar/nucleoside kinase (ribokinase family)